MHQPSVINMTQLTECARNGDLCLTSSIHFMCLKRFNSLAARGWSMLIMASIPSLSGWVFLDPFPIQLGVLRLSASAASCTDSFLTSIHSFFYQACHYLTRAWTEGQIEVVDICRSMLKTHIGCIRISLRSCCGPQVYTCFSLCAFWLATVFFMRPVSGS